ncbi:MAG: ATP-binding protein, partial [Gammaproteobacteria bacterium]|nr:ATP-binding protein [Gammaproteobacteria bacterium]
KPIEAKKKGDVTAGRLFIADQSSKRFFQHALQSKEAVSMSDFELGQVTPGADFCPSMVRYSVPIHDELDRLDGLLVVNIWGSRLDASMETSMAGYPGKVYIVELSEDRMRDGIYLYHPDTRKRFADQMNSNFRFSEELGRDVWQTIKQGKVAGTVFAGEERMLFYRKISPFSDRPTQWLLVVDADRNVLFAQVNRMRQSIWVLLGILMFISLFLAIWASGRLARPVHSLAEIIKRYADGDHSAVYTDKRNDEIGIAGNAFNYLKHSLEKAEADKAEAEKMARQSERLASVGQLAAGIGHEINNPLMNIMSLASLVESTLKNENEDACNDLRLLKKEGERCARIVQGILNFARENKPTYEDFSITVLIEETTALLQHRAGHSSISIKLELEANLHMEGDRNQLQQVLVNVILNAIQASPEGSQISIKAWQQEEHIYLEILDHGCGIDNENVMKIFDPFFTTKEEGKGTGLGLSVSYGIIKHHGGTINIENMNHAGVLVQIVLPVRAGTSKINQEVLEAVNGK